MSFACLLVARSSDSNQSAEVVPPSKSNNPHPPPPSPPVRTHHCRHTHHYLRTFPVVRNHSTAHDYIAPRGTVHIQSGIAGTGDSDPFTAPQLEYEAFRDTQFVPTYGRLTFFNDTLARYEQLFNDNGTVFDSFDLARGPPPYGTSF